MQNPNVPTSLADRLANLASALRRIDIARHFADIPLAVRGDFLPHDPLDVD